MADYTKVKVMKLSDNLYMLNTDDVQSIVEDPNILSGLKVGDATNYVLVNDTYGFQFNGSATTYNDLPPVTLMSLAQGAVNKPTLTTMTGGVKALTFAVNDIVYGAQEITHDWLEGTDLDIHIHWANNGLEAVDKYVKWQMEYIMADRNGVFAGSTISDEFKIAANTTSLTHILSELPDITMTGKHIGCYIIYAFSRIASTGAAPAANPFAFTLGIHIQQSTLGSRELYTK